MKIRIGALFLSLLISVSSSYASNPNNSFDSLIVFGDSLSDNGNLYWYLWGYLPLSPPYYQGRFSNGPIWAEYLYQQLFGDDNPEGFQDYAVGGAGAVLSYKEVLPYTLGMELKNYFYWHAYGNPKTALFTIWIGANNYIKAPENVEELTTGVVNATLNVIEQIIQKGGDKFVIANLPDMGLAPEARAMGRTALLSELIMVHNAKLARGIEELKTRYPDVTLLSLDAYRLFAEVMENPQEHGFKNVTDPCYPGSYTGWLEAVQITPNMIYSRSENTTPRLDREKWSMIANNPQLMAAARVGYIYQNLPRWLQEEPPHCDGFMFWDHIHPSTIVHQRIGQHVAELIESAGLKAVALPVPVEKKYDGKTVQS